MSDSYYELVHPTDELGERFRATDFVRSTWSPDIQHGAPVSALLVRGLRGTLFSVPELGFVSIRKGTFAWAPRAHDAQP